MAGNAVKEAAEFALRKWRREDRPATAEATWLAPKTTDLDPKTGYGVPNFAYGYVAEAVESLERFGHLIDDIEGIENRLRRRDVLISEEDLFAFYKEKLPGIHTVKMLSNKRKFIFFCQGSHYDNNIISENI